MTSTGMAVRAVVLAFIVIALPHGALATPPAPATSTQAVESEDAAKVREAADAFEATESRTKKRIENERVDVDFVGRLFQSFFALAAVVVLIYIILGKGLPKVLQLSPTARRGMIAMPSRGVVEVVDRLPLDPRRSLYVVKVGAAYFLVGVGDQGMTMLSKLDESDLASVAENIPDAKPVLERFSSLFGARQGGKSS
jgi:flagellar protein FliO/FliZ